MHHQIAENRMEGQYPLWISAMMQHGNAITIGNNPVLPSVIHHTWKWPCVFIEFYLENDLVALVSFVKIRHNWVSLPHFDHDSMWINHKLLIDLPPVSQISGRYREEDVYRGFYGISSRLLAVYENNNSFDHGAVIHARVEVEDIIKIKNSTKIQDRVKLISRNQFPVLKHTDSSKVIPTLLLQDDYDHQFERFNAGVRRKIRKAESNGITVKSGGAELVDAFYKVYRSNIRRLGSFGLPKSFFKNLIDGYQFGFARVFIAALDQKPVGAAILLNFATHAENGWFASLQDYNKHYVTYALHYAMISYAVKNRCKVYSFGRSTNQSSGHHYKTQWGTSDIPLTLSSTQQIMINPDKYKFVSTILKVLPDKLLNPLDGYVSKIIY